MGLLNNINLMRKQRRAADHLRILPDRTLADIGIQRDNIEEYIRKSINQ